VCKNGVLLTKDRSGRPSGTAYVVFATAEDFEKALEKNNANMGHRYVMNFGKNGLFELSPKILLMLLPVLF
jgi:hypothetical protein